MGMAKKTEIKLDDVFNNKRQNSVDGVVGDWNKYKISEPVEPEIKPVEKNLTKHESELKNIYADAAKSQIGDLSDDKILQPASNMKFTPKELEKIKFEIKRIRKSDSNVRYITSASESTKQEVEQSDVDNSKQLHDSIFAELKSIKTEIKKITKDIEVLKLKKPLTMNKELIPGELAHGLACTLLD